MSETAAVATGEWRRTSWRGLLVRAIMNLRNLLLPMAAALVGTQGMDKVVLYVLPMIVLGVGLTFLISWIGWRHFRYLVGSDDIRVERGLLNRTARSVPYERIQDVSVTQPLIPRLFQLVEIKFETGAGGKDEVKIGYITEAEGEALRETVRARKSGEIAATDESAAPVEEPSRVLFTMGPKRLLTFGLFEFSLIVFAVLGGAAQQFDFLIQFERLDFGELIRLLGGSGDRLQQLGLVAQAIAAALALAVLALVGLLTGLGRTVLRDWGFRLEETPKGLRRRRGLLTRTDVVMPVHRVQALKVTTGILRRRWGWHGLSVVSLATDAKSASHVVVPFARMDEIAPVVETTGFALPSSSTEWRLASLRHRRDSIVLAVVPSVLLAVAAAVAGRQLDAPVGWPWLVAAGLLAFGGFLTLREWHPWRHRRHAVDAQQLFVRHGWLAPRLDIASRVKLQSVEIAQGPLARRHGYADVKFGVAGGTLEMHGVPLEAAHAMRAAVLESIASLDFSRLPG